MRSAAANAARVLDQLEDSLSHGTVERRVQTLRKITDLFLVNSSNYTDEHTAIFDDVFQVLVCKIEISAKILLSQRLAPIASAPPRIVHTLAFDDIIDVAGPMLTHSERLTDEMLVENATLKSQAHLLAISRRRRLSSVVTDVLVDRGDSNVVNSVVANLGAEFSENGYSRLLELAERDDDLATCVGTRPSIPRHHFVQLLSRASGTVRSRLQALNSQAKSEVEAAVNQAAMAASNRSAMESVDMVAALRLVEELYHDDKLTADRITEFANAGKFEETNAALALLANVPVALVENMMVTSQSEGVMILTKVADMPWPVVQAVLNMRTRLSGAPAVDLNFCRVSYNRLKVATAQQVLRFHRMRLKSG
jgi:uncharacterized protein (DUF2336 family)